MDSGLLPSLDRDLTAYVTGLQQIVTEHNLHATSVIRLKDACYCRRNGIDCLSQEGTPAALRARPDYNERYFGNGAVGDPNNPRFAKYWAVETNLGTLLFSRYTDTGLAGLFRLQQSMEEHYFDRDFPFGRVRQYEVRTLNHAPLPGTDAYYHRAILAGNDLSRFALPDDVFCDRAIVQDGVCVAANDMALTLKAYRQFVENNLLDCTYRSGQIALLLQIRESGWDSLDSEQRQSCRFHEHFRAVHFGAGHPDFQTETEKASLLKNDRLYAGDLLKQFYPTIRKDEPLRVPSLEANVGQKF